MPGRHTSSALKQRAVEEAARLLDSHRTGAVLPLMPALSLMTKAWLAGYRVRNPEPKETTR